MKNKKEEAIIEIIKKWIEKIVIGLDFCPFARKEFVKDSIRYKVTDATEKEVFMQSLIEEFNVLSEYKQIATTLIILTDSCKEFSEFLDVVEIAELCLIELGYEGEFQFATFHPDYCFEGISENDLSNFTNKSPFPIIHILKEETIEKAIEVYPNPERIPEKNINLIYDKGEIYIKELFKSVFS